MERVIEVGPDFLRLPRRPREAHKGDFGRVCILGGSVGYSGAVVLAAKGAERSGAGLVTVLTPAPVWSVAAARLDCAMPWPLPPTGEGMLSWDALAPALERLSAADAALIGPGLSRGAETARTVRELIRRLEVPLVLDADGINALEGHIDVLDSRRGRLTVLTPHEGEFGRLCPGLALPIAGRYAVARDFAAAHGCVVVLKGHRTVTAFPDGTAFINTSGNPGMAKGGSGDVLAGLLVGLLGQGLPPREAVPGAVWLHGAAGDLAAGALGEYAMTPADLVAYLPQVMKQAEE